MNELSAELDALLDQVRRQQEEVARIQQSIAELEVTGTSRGDEVRATVQGSGRFTAVQLDAETMRRYQPHEVEELVLEAVNDALARLAETTRAKYAPIIESANGSAVG
jgi:nucleoid-associated protein EbfC